MYQGIPEITRITRRTLDTVELYKSVYINSQADYKLLTFQSQIFQRNIHCVTTTYKLRDAIKFLMVYLIQGVK